MNRLCELEIDVGGQWQPARSATSGIRQLFESPTVAFREANRALNTSIHEDVDIWEVVPALGQRLRTVECDGTVIVRTMHSRGVRAPNPTRKQYRFVLYPTERDALVGCLRAAAFFEEEPPFLSLAECRTHLEEADPGDDWHIERLRQMSDAVLRSFVDEIQG